MEIKNVKGDVLGVIDCVSGNTESGYQVINATFGILSYSITDAAKIITGMVYDRLEITGSGKIFVDIRLKGVLYGLQLDINEIESSDYYQVEHAVWLCIAHIFEMYTKNEMGHGVSDEFHEKLRVARLEHESWCSKRNEIGILYDTSFYDDLMYKGK